MRIDEPTVAPYRSGWGKYAYLPGNGLGSALPERLFSFRDSMLPCGEGVPFGAFLVFTQQVPVLRDGSEWFGIQHQAGGLSCSQRYFVGVPFPLRSELEPSFTHIVADHYGKYGGHFYRESVRLGDLLAYGEALRAVGVHCDSSYRLLEEGVYPIDATQAHLDILADKQSVAMSDALGHGGVAIVILAENSD